MAVTWTELHEQGDLLANDRFKLLFGSIPGGGDAKALTVLCDHLVVPAHSQGHVRVNILGFPTGFAGNTTFDNVMSASFYENVRGTVGRALTGWRANIQDHSSGLRPLKRQYAVGAQLIFYDVVHAATLTFDMTGVFPFSVQYPEAAEETGPAKYEVQFNVDSLELVTASHTGDAPTRAGGGNTTPYTAADNSYNIGAVGGNSLANLTRNPMSVIQFADRFLRSQ